jgi:hypothetical protein
MTLGLVIGRVVAIAPVAGFPAAVQLIAVGTATKWLLMVVQWPLLIVLVMLVLAAPGAITATILWIVASIGFTVYVANSTSYDNIYGSLGGVVTLQSDGNRAVVEISGLAASVREIAEERPLISLLFAFQVGFAVGRWGPRRAISAAYAAISP